MKIINQFTLLLLLSTFISVTMANDSFDVLTKDSSLTQQKVEAILKDTAPDSKFKLRIIKPSEAIDPKILGNIKDAHLYKIVVIDPEKAELKKDLTENLNKNLKFSDGIDLGLFPKNGETIIPYKKP